MSTKTKARTQSHKVKERDLVSKADRLRELRLASEAARKEAGTWGDRMVGEIWHPSSQSVYVQIWRGRRWPDPLVMNTAQSARISAVDWIAIVDWKKSRETEDFSRQLLAWNLSAEEAQKVKVDRIRQHFEAGRKVVNPDCQVEVAAS